MSENEQLTQIIDVLKQTGYNASSKSHSNLQIGEFHPELEYYKLFKKSPNIVYIGHQGETKVFNTDKVLEKIKTVFKNSEIIKSKTSYYFDYNKEFISSSIIKLDEDCLLFFKGSGPYEFLNIRDGFKVKNDEPCTTTFYIFEPQTNIRNDIKKTFYEILNECEYEREEEKSYISMITKINGNLNLRSFTINDVEIEDLDLHYGRNFTEFNKNLLDKIKNNSKGLILLNGEPGTGKSYYIRYLLSEIKKDKTKEIIYIPPHMVSAIMDPEFILMMQNNLSGFKNNIILIEDAEFLLESRDNSKNIGISNLLNLTDGLLNDIFKVQIIATFNTEKEQNLDSALLRPERLLAKKQFDKLDYETITKLAKKLLIDTSHLNPNGMTLAEIYSIKNNTEPIKEIKIRKKIGF